MKRVELVAPFRIPYVCCVCLKPAETAIKARHSRFIPLGLPCMLLRPEIGIPFCALHARQTRMKMRLCKVAMVFCYLLCCLVGKDVFVNFGSHPPILQALPFLLFGLAIFFGFFERAQMPVRLRAPKAEREKIIGSSRLARAALDCNNPDFALAVLDANKQVQQDKSTGGDHTT